MNLNTRSLTYATCLIIALITCEWCTAFGTVFYRKPASMGKDYYIVFPRTGDLKQDSTTAALINSPVKQTLTITLPGAAHKKYATTTTPGPASSTTH